MADGAGGGGSTGRTIAIVAGVVLLLGCLCCGGSLLVCSLGIASSVPRVGPRQPATVDASLYQGTWTGPGPTTLTITPTSVAWDRQEGGMHTRYTAQFVGISGQNIRVSMGIEMELAVSEPPHQDPSTGQWEMTVEGVPMVRTQ